MSNGLPLVLAWIVACGSPLAEAPPVADSDGDTILDVHEGEADPDGDGLPNSLDDDSDGDTLPDSLEAGDSDPLTLPRDADGDGTPDYLDLDSDGNRESDEEEHDGRGNPPDPDGDGIGDPWDLDDDNDGAWDLEESYPAGARRDTDKDGDIDRIDLDSDDDGASDLSEAREFPWLPLRDTDADGTPDLRDLDSDGDGWSDVDEVGDGPEPRDTDGDGTPDLRDVDSDNDGLSDAVERRGYSHPYRRDTDGDGFPDGVEVALGTDPGKPGSKPTGPVVELSGRERVSVDLDLVARHRRMDIVVVVEPTTGSGDGNSATLAREFFQLVMPALQERLPGAAIGVYALVGHPDYPSNRGREPGPPLVKLLPLTLDPERISNVDMPRVERSYSTFDSLYPLLEGTGYDRDCDGVFDEERDILPFLPSSEDPFSGKAGGRYDPTDPPMGFEPGVGFRTFALRMMVDLRAFVLFDASIPAGMDWQGGPGGCPYDVDRDDFVAALRGRDVLYMGVPQAAEGDLPATAEQMRYVAEHSGSFGDVDDDGTDEPLVITALNVWDISTLEPSLETIARVAEQRLNRGTFRTLQPVVEYDPHGMVVDIQPRSVPYVDNEGPQPVRYTLTLEGTVAPSAADRVVRLRIATAGDGAVALDATDLFAVIPGDGKE